MVHEDSREQPPKRVKVAARVGSYFSLAEIEADVLEDSHELLAVLAKAVQVPTAVKLAIVRADETHNALHDFALGSRFIDEMVGPSLRGCAAPLH